MYIRICSSLYLCRSLCLQYAPRGQTSENLPRHLAPQSQHLPATPSPPKGSKYLTAPRPPKKDLQCLGDQNPEWLIY